MIALTFEPPVRPADGGSAVPIMTFQSHICRRGGCMVAGWLLGASWHGLAGPSAVAQVPALIGHQGRVAVLGNPFDGVGRFKFALVDAGATTTYWRNAPDADGNGEPDQAVSLTVSRGLYSVALGDTSVSQMAPLAPSALQGEAVHLRVWFDDGTHGFQRLNPDHRVTSVGYALIASTVPDGTLGAGKLAPGVLSFENLSGALGPAQMPAGLAMVSESASDPGLLGAGFQRFLTVPAPGWTAGTVEGAPLARSGHATVWTGERMLVWGGASGSGQALDTGAAYDPAADRWTALSSIDRPSARSDFASAWTGREWILWGGLGLWGYLSTGARYDVARTVWTPLPIAGAPGGRAGAASAWTGDRFLVWGGRDDGGPVGDGASVGWTEASWSPLPTSGAPTARFGATGVWTGVQWILWGGQGVAGFEGTGARLTVRTGLPASWTPTTAVGAPSARTEHVAVWTGQRMVVWGGRGSGLGNYRSDGASYDPVLDVWAPMSEENAPSGRSGHAAVWTGSEVLILGGQDGQGLLASGHAWDPVRNRWRQLSQEGNPAPRRNSTAVWAETEALVFGGQGSGGNLGLLQRLDPRATTHFYRKP